MVTFNPSTGEAKSRNLNHRDPDTGVVEREDLNATEFIPFEGNKIMACNPKRVYTLTLTERPDDFQSETAPYPASPE